MVLRRQVSGSMITVLAALGLLVRATTVHADSGSPPPFQATLGGPGHATIYPAGLEIAADGGIVIADIGNDRVVKYSPSGTQVWSAGTPGSGIGQFLDPRDVGIDSAGNLYVADNSNGRIVKLDPTGNWITSWHGPAGNHLSAPIGVTVTNNLVYVADGVQRQVRVFDTLGNQQGELSTNGICVFSHVRDADADASGNIYIADYLNDDILKLSPTGTCITKWGTKGTLPGQFLNPYGIRVAFDPVLNSQAVYVADSNNERIQEFLMDGTFVTSIGSSGTAPGTFTQLRRVAVAADGTVWGADLWGFRIESFTRTAQGYSFNQTIGGTPPPLTSTNTFNKPHGIAFDPSGNLAVVDTVNQRLVRMSPSGAILGACGQRGFQLGQENWPRGVAIDPVTGQIWIADTKQSNIQIIQPNCTSVTKFGAFGTGLNQFHWPFSITIRQSDGTAWIADTLNNRIVSYSVAIRQPIAAFGSLGSGSGQFSAPGGIAISPSNGHILVADSKNNRVVELTDSGGASISVVRSVTDGFNNPQGVSADSAGRIYVADSGNSRVVALNPDGTELGTITTGVSQPENLAVNASGQLYVADTFNDNILVYGSSTPPLNGPPTFVGTLEGPGLASMYPVDATNTSSEYYVMDAGRYRVVAVNRSTGNVDFQTNSVRGSGPDQFSDARAIDVDGAGNVYVADTSNSRVEVFDPSLNFLTQWGSSGTGPGQFTQDYGIAIGQGIGATGSLIQIAYVVDGAGRVEKFDLSGNFISQFGVGLLKDPRQVTVDPVNNNVYVVNARMRQIAVFDVNGNELFTFGSNGTGPGQFSDDPRGIALSSDGTRAYATDSGGKRVEVFDANTGAFLFQVGGPGTAPGQFTDPRGLTVTPDGDLLVTDEFGFSVNEFLLDGTFVRRLFGTPPPTPGVNNPRGVRVDPTGRVYMVDWWNQRIDSINPDGSNAAAFGFRGTSVQPGSINFAWDVAIQPGTNRLFVANRESHEIEVFESTGTFVTRFGSRGSQPGQFLFPQGDTFAPDGTLLVADSGNDRIQRFSISSAGTATFLATYGQTGSALQGAGFLNTPTGISTASDGTIWVADTLNNSVQNMSPSGVWTRFTAPGGTTHFRAPWGITVAPDGSIWVSDTGSNRIVKMQADGSLFFVASGQDMGAGTINPFTIAFGFHNHIYLSDIWNDRVIDLVSS